MMRALLLVILLAGCTGTFDPLPYQDLYVEKVWHEAYGEDRDPPPIEWIHADSWDVLGEGYDGFTWAGWKVQVACGEKCDDQVEDTALAHELMHMRTFWRTGDVDAFHWRGDWTLAQAATDTTYGVIQAQRVKDR